jgi:hypothetical protein
MSRHRVKEPPVVDPLRKRGDPLGRSRPVQYGSGLHLGRDRSGVVADVLDAAQVDRNDIEARSRSRKRTTMSARSSERRRSGRLVRRSGFEGGVAETPHH